MSEDEGLSIPAGRRRIIFDSSSGMPTNCMLYIIQRAHFSKQNPIIRLPVILIVFQVVSISILAQRVSPFDSLQNRYVDTTHMGLNINLAEETQMGIDI